MKRKLREARGFTLIEMAVVILLLGIIAAFGVPAYVKLNRTLQLKGAVANLASQLQLSRQKAMATGAPQYVFFRTALGGNFNVRSGSTTATPTGVWKFPNGVTYYWGSGTVPDSTLQMKADGRSDRSGMVILQMTPGSLRDTVNVQLSGLVLQQ